MNLSIESQSAYVQCPVDTLDALVDRLERAGYEPLIRKAASQFATVFGGNADDLFMVNNDEDEDDSSSHDSEEVRKKLLNLEKIGYMWGTENLRGFAKVPQVKGDIFYTDDNGGLLFVTMVESGPTSQGMCVLRVGYMGDSEDETTMTQFLTAVDAGLTDLNLDAGWTPDNVRSKSFDELALNNGEAQLQPATSMNEREVRAAKVLENASVREVAMLVRRSGVMLAKELLRQKAEQASDIIRYVDQLLQVNVLHQEYVVVCQKSGAHVNRVESRDVIDQMSRLGVLCSCGKPISEEQIEGLLASDPLMPRMLDNNYWMAATVVRLLNQMDIPSDRILIDVSSTGEDLEMFADVDGTLVMFELKDSEYGLNNAYSLGARIGMHRPDLAFIVSTKGIASEVKDHFKRLKPEAKLVYVPNLIQMEATLKKVIEGIRQMRVKTWLAYYQTMLSFPITPLVIPKLQTGKFEIPHMVTSVQLQTDEVEEAERQAIAR